MPCYFSFSRKTFRFWRRKVILLNSEFKDRSRVVVVIRDFSSFFLCAACPNAGTCPFSRFDFSRGVEWRELLIHFEKLSSVPFSFRDPLANSGLVQKISPKSEICGNKWPRYQDWRLSTDLKRLWDTNRKFRLNNLPKCLSAISFYTTQKMKFADMISHLV